MFVVERSNGSTLQSVNPLRWTYRDDEAMRFADRKSAVATRNSVLAKHQVLNGSLEITDDTLPL